VIKIVKWSTDWSKDEQIKGTYLVLFNRFSMSKGQWKGLLFDIQGLGKSKNEKLLGLKRNLNHITLYFLKWYFNYDKEGYKNALHNVNITSERVI